MGFLGNLFGGEKSADGLSDRDKQMAGLDNSEATPVNAEGGVDFVNNATSVAQPIESTPAAPEQTSSAPVGQSTAEVAVNEPASAENMASPEVAPVAEVDEAAVAANVDQQLAGAGFVPSGEVSVQPEAGAAASPEQPDSLEVATPAESSPDQAVQPSHETTQAG